MKIRASWLAVLLALTNVPAAPAIADELSCADGGECVIGDIGPGGGVVFYVSKKLESWGRYIEVAPNGWNRGRPDPNVEPYCYERSGIFDDLPETSPKIGMGKANTDKVVKVCPNGAAAVARAYSGGGYKTWSLPSKDEFTEVYYEGLRHGITLNDGNPWYWSSTGDFGRVSSFYVPFEEWDGTFAKSNDAHVRPVRHFMTSADWKFLDDQKKNATLKYKNCSELNKNFPGGLSKAASSKNKGSKTKLQPYVSSKGYNLNKSLDRDKDGIACER